MGVVGHVLDVQDWQDYRKNLPNAKTAMHKLQAMVESFRQADMGSIVRTEPINWNFSTTRSILESDAQKADVKLEIAEKLPDRLTMDWPKVERAIINLVGNACECGAKNVRLVICTDGPKMLVQVHDDGPGVSKQLMPKLFTHGATYGKTDGTGLGLSFVRQIAKGHGGDARYHREDGWSVFQFHLPHADMVAWNKRGLKNHERQLTEQKAERNRKIAEEQKAARQKPKSKLVVVTDDSLLSELKASDPEILRGFDIVSDSKKVAEALLLVTSDSALLLEAMKAKVQGIMVRPNDDKQRIITKVSSRLSLMARSANPT